MVGVKNPPHEKNQFTRYLDGSGEWVEGNFKVKLGNRVVTVRRPKLTVQTK